MEESQLNSNLDPNLMQFDLGYHQHSDQPNKIQAHSQEEQTHRKQPDSHEKLSTQEQLVAQDKQLDQQQPFNISEQNKTHDELNSSTIQQDQLIIHQQNIITLQEMPTKQSHHETSEPRAASQEQPSHPSSSPAIPHVDSGNGSNMINMEKSNQSVNDPGNIDPSAVQMVEQEMVKPICLKSLKKTEESKEEVAQPIKKNEDSVSSGLQPAEEKNKLDESKLQLVEQEKSLQSVGLSEKLNQPVLELMEKQEKLDESVPQPVERNEASVEPVLQLVKKREELVEPVLQRVKSVTLNESVLQSVEKNPQFVQLVVIQPVTKGEQLVEPVLQPVIKSVSDELVLQPIENKEEVREQPMEKKNEELREQPMEKKNEELREPILQPVEKDQDLLEPVLQPAKKNEALVDPVLQPVNNVTSNQSVHQPIEKNEESREQIHQPVEKNQVLVEPVLQPLFADPVLHPVIKVTSDEPVLQPMEKNEELREPSLQLVEKNEESVEPVIQPVKKNEKSVDSVLHPVIKVTSDESVLQPTKKKEKIDEPVLQPVEKNVLQPVEKNEQVTTNKSVVDPVLQPVRHVTLEKSAPQPLEKQEEAGESVFQTVEKNKQVVEPVLQLVKKNQEVVDPQEFVDPMLQPVKNVKLNQPIFQPIEKREKPGESIRQPVQKSEKLVETVFQQVDKNEKSGDSVLLPIKKDMTNTLLKPLEIILPTNRFLFPEYEQSLRFDLTQLQCLDRMRQETQNSKDNAPPHLVVSVGKIPSPPGTRAGQPFEDGFTCLISPSSPTHSDIQPESINYERSNQIDPSLLPSSSHVPHRRVGRPRKSAVPYVVPKSTTQPRQSALDKKIEENKPVIGLASQPIKEKPRTNTRSSMVTRATTSSSGQQQGGGQSSSAHVISETAGPSNLSRKKEPWLTALKATYAANKRKYSKLIVPYPQVGDSFKTIENFKEGCLLASWAAGHDMHVRNHYKTDLWERCVFTCRHDRSPPKGLNCPFKIVAMGNRVDMKPGQPVESWKVIKSHPVHGNHEVGPGAFDPLGKRTYRKRGAADSIAEGQEAGGQQSTESMQPSRKRRKPRRSSERIDQPLLRPKPPPSVALPAPSAVQKVAPKVETPPSPTLDNSSDSDLYFPGDSGHSSASANVLHSRANLQETTS